MRVRGTVQIGQHRYRVVSSAGAIVAESEFDSAETLTEQLSEVLDALRGAPWELEVGRPWAQVRRIRDLPPVKERHLTGIVQSDSGRYFRIRPGELHVEARRGDEDRVVGIAVDAWLPAAVSAAARRRGGGLVAATVIGAGEARHPVTPPEVRRDRRRLVFRTLVAWVPVAIVPWFVAGAVYAADLHRDLRTLEAGQRDLAVAEKELSRIQVELGEASKVVESVRRTGRAAAWAVPLLASLARDLPVAASIHSLTADRAGVCAVEVTGDTTGVGDALGWPTASSSGADPAGAESCR